MNFQIFELSPTMLKINLPDFNIDQIARSGQCFRMQEDALGYWSVLASGKYVKIRQLSREECIFECSRQEFDNFWYNYFDLKMDYGAVKKFIRSFDDEFLTAAVNFGYGIRILRQDLWEMIITFIISQRNNIPRIKKSITALCENFGKFFPTAIELKKFNERDFIALGLGYRAAYIKNIVDAVASGELNLEYLKTLNYVAAINYLKKFKGIGDKVANCIALYGLHKMEAFPIDVWIQRAINLHYDGNFPYQKVQKFAGIIQQYIFFYQKNLKVS